MGKQELIKLCDEFNGSREEFSCIVSNALECGIEKKDLARKFELPPSWIDLYTKNAGSPHPAVRKILVQKIRSMLPG